MKLTPALLTTIVSLGILWTALPSMSVSNTSAIASSSWTIMAYMADDTPVPLPWEDNIDSMEAAEQAPGTNVVALVDPGGSGNSRLLKIAHDPATPSTSIISQDLEDSGQVIPSNGEVNMASSDTLASFVDFVTSSFPADRYFLLLWGHGDGWHGLCPDGSDLLTLPELRMALDAIRAGLGRPLDMMAIDACAQATVELMAQIQSCVDYLVASETNIPSQGLPYTELLNALAADTGQSPEEFGSRIAEEYVDRAWESSPYSATMGVFNISRVGELLADLSSLSDLGIKYDALFHDSLKDAIDFSETYGTDWYPDLGNLLCRIQGNRIPLELRMMAMQTGLSYNAVIASFEKYNNPDPYDGIGVQNATGAAIYAPSGIYPDTLYEALMVSSGSWDEFAQLARATRAEQESGPGPVASTADSNGDGLDDVVTLSWNDTADSYAAWVFRDGQNGLVDCGYFESSTSPIIISGIIGRLLVTASSVVGGLAISYAELSVQLSGTVSISVELVRNGLPLLEGYEIRVTSDRMSRVFNSTELGMFDVNITVPYMAEVGELITIDAINIESGMTVGSTKLFLPSSQTSAEVEVYEAENDSSGFYAMLFISVLPGLLVLAFAGVMYRDTKKGRKD